MTTDISNVTQGALKMSRGISIKRWTDSQRRCRWPSQQLDDRLFFQWTQIWFHKPEKYPEAAVNPYSHKRHLKDKTERKIINRFPNILITVPSQITSALTIDTPVLLCSAIQTNKAQMIYLWYVFFLVCNIPKKLDTVYFVYLHYCSKVWGLLFILL